MESTIPPKLFTPVGFKHSRKVFSETRFDSNVVLCGTSPLFCESQSFSRVTFKSARNNRAHEFSSGEFTELAPRGKKVNRFKTFGEPVVNSFQQRDGFPLAALIGP